MMKMNAGVGIVLTATAAVLLAGLGVVCLPWGINDPQSSSGFLILALFFFITSIGRAMTIQFGELEENTTALVDCFFRGVNKSIAAGLIFAFAVPHPHFTGIVLWTSVAALLTYSGLKNFVHVGFVVHKGVKTFMEQRKAVKEHLKRNRAMVELMNLQKEQAKWNAQAEEELVADLASYLASTDPTDNSKK
jgi:hypothetical protein